MPFLETIGTASAKAYGEGINNITQSYWFFTAKDASGTPGDGNVNLGLDSSNNFLLTGNTNVASAIAMNVNTISGTVNYQNLLVDPGGSHLGISYGACADNNNNQYWAGLQNNASNQQNAWIAKYNSSGALQWQRIYSGNTSGPYARFWNVVSDGTNVYAAGYQSTNSIYNASAQLGLVTKYNSSGTLQWAYNIVPGAAYSSGGSNSYSIGTDSSGNIYSAGSITSSGSGYYGGYVAKINSAGTLQWATTLTDTLQGTQLITYGISVDSSGNVYTGGYSAYSGGSIGYIAKLNSSGALQWSAYIQDNGTTHAMGVSNIWPDNNGNVFVFAGGYNGSNQSVGWIGKYDASTGTLIWQRQLSNPVGTPSFGMGGKPRLDNNGNLCFTGSLNPITGGGSIAFAMKLPADGTLLGTYSTSQSTVTYSVGTFTRISSNFTANTSPGITLVTAYNGDGAGTLTNTTGTMVTASVPYNLYISTSGVTTAVVSGASSAGSVTAGGGSNNFNFTISSGNLPTGLSLDGNTGAISGTATTTGSYSTIFQVTDTTTSQIATSNTVTFTVSSPLYAFPVGTTFPLSTGGIGGTNGGTNNAGVTTGPTLAQVLSTYSSVTWPWITNTAYFNMNSYQGYQKWTVPVTGTYKIVCSGAGAGYNPSTGGQSTPAVASGTFALTQGQILIFVVGQLGGYSPYGGQAPCGGGGTFAFLNATQSTSSYTTSTCLLAAGGAGGVATGNGGSATQGNGQTGTSGGASGDNVYAGGTNGGAFIGTSAGADGLGGAGITSGPTSAIGGTPPTAISSGGVGGYLQYSSYGGFGGGGGFWGGGGGGGGYSGGAPGHWSVGATGGGGGSYVASSATNGGISVTGTPLYNGGASITRIS